MPRVWLLKGGEGRGKTHAFSEGWRAEQYLKQLPGLGKDAIEVVDMDIPAGAPVVWRCVVYLKRSTQAKVRKQLWPDDFSRDQWGCKFSVDHQHRRLVAMSTVSSKHAKACGLELARELAKAVNHGARKQLVREANQSHLKDRGLPGKTEGPKT